MSRWIGALASVWLGMQVMAGYIAAPILFKALPKLQAGAIAGDLFDVVLYSGLLIWMCVYIVGKNETKIGCNRWYIGALIVFSLLAVNQFLITPVIEAHKNHTQNWLLDIVGGSFGVWHGISSLIYMICAIVATLVIVRIVKSHS